MSLNIIDDSPQEATEEQDERLQADGTYEGSKGGTEMLKEELVRRMEILEPGLMEKVDVICSRTPKNFKPKKPTILWLHDTHNDPAVQHLRSDVSRSRFKILVFVSHHQQAMYNAALGVPMQSGLVIDNAINPIEYKEKDMDGPIRMIYHTTPHRGLEILAQVFDFLKTPDEREIILDVFSSFEIYGWPEKDKQFEKIFDICREHPRINYHGYQPNEVVREALQKAHIFAYPNIWPETSCLSVIEAMSAGCQIVCPTYGALPETTAKLAFMYPFQEEIQHHANMFVASTNSVLGKFPWDEATIAKLNFQKTYINSMHSWSNLERTWLYLLKDVAKSGE